jgi:hypothetical protein
MSLLGNRCLHSTILLSAAGILTPLPSKELTRTEEALLVVLFFMEVLGSNLGTQIIHPYRHQSFVDFIRLS